MIKTSRFRRLFAPTIFGLSVLSYAMAQASDETGPTFNAAPKDERGRFINTDKNLSRGSKAVQLSFFMRRFATVFRTGSGAPNLMPNDGVLLRDSSTPRITWIGHATLLVQMDGVNFLTDPIWSKTPSPVPFLGPSRWVAPGVEIDDLPTIDFVVISHNHYDHLDLPTLRKLAQLNESTVFFVPLGNADLLQKNGIQQVREMDWGDRVAFKETTIYCLPTQHWSKRSLTDTQKSLWSSWAVIGPERRFYFAGDTGYFDGFKEIGDKLGPFDLAAVPVGAYEPSAMMKASHLNPEEAVQAAQDVQAKTAVAMHFGTFDLSDEPIDEPPLRFNAAIEGAEAIDGWVLDIGETRGF